MGYIGQNTNNTNFPIDVAQQTDLLNDDNQHRKLLSTIDAAGVDNPTFSSSVITDDYDYYDVYVYDVKPTTNANDSLNYIWCRFQQGGSTISSSSYMTRG